MWNRNVWVSFTSVVSLWSTQRLNSVASSILITNYSYWVPYKSDLHIQICNSKYVLQEKQCLNFLQLNSDICIFSVPYNLNTSLNIWWHSKCWSSDVFSNQNPAKMSYILLYLLIFICFSKQAVMTSSKAFGQD